MSPAAAYSEPTPTLTAQRGGLAHSATTSRMSAPATRALHIASEILAQPGLSLLACAVLAEIVDLYQVKGSVFAKDEHFAERCKSKARTIRETIAELETGGYLTRVVDYSARHKRQLIPTDKWRILPEVVADFATTTPEVVADFATTPGEICQELWQNPPGVVAKSANINTNLNTSSNTTLKTHPSAVASEVVPEKKIEVELAHMKAKRPAPRTRGAASQAEEPAAFADFWQVWPRGEKRGEALKAFTKLSDADQAAATSRANAWLAARPDLAEPDRQRYIPHAASWLNQARWTDNNPTVQPHATHAAPSPTSYPPRPVNGHKPLGNGGSLARFLAEQD
jgi:hypothetical protein